MLLTSLLSKEKDFEPLLFALKKENKDVVELYVTPPYTEGGIEKDFR